MKKILIVEDDNKLNDGIKLALRNEFFCLQAFSLQSASDIYKEQSIDLIILDINMPDGNGIDFMIEIRKTETIPIILLTANKMEMDIVSGLELGANDYITKPFSMVLLGRRVTALLRRSGKCAISNIMAFGDVQVNFSGYTASDQNGKIDITPKELDLLKLLVEHKGLVLTRSQIMDELWGYDCSIIDRTIDTYIKNLRKKLRLDCIVTVKGIGYKYEVTV